MKAERKVDNNREVLAQGQSYQDPIEAILKQVKSTVHFELPQTEVSNSSVNYLKIEENQVHQGAKSVWVDVTNIVDF